MDVSVVSLDLLTGTLTYLVNGSHRLCRFENAHRLPEWRHFPPAVQSEVLSNAVRKNECKNVSCERPLELN